MLRHLYISSFVIIDKMNIDIEEGMNVLTGETGSGKSIIVDAIGQLCGQRSSSSLVKKGCDKASIEGIFDIDINDEYEHLCDELHIDCSDQLVVSKDIYSNGKSQVKINYQQSSTTALKLLMPYLIDIHSQFETQKIFKVSHHLSLLDEYAKEDLGNLKIDYENTYNHYLNLQNQKKIYLEEDASDEQLDFLQSQWNEINDYHYTDDEIDELEEEFKALESYECIQEDFNDFDNYMNSTHGVLSSLKCALQFLESMAQKNDYQDLYESLNDEYYSITDLYESIVDEHRHQYFDEYRYNELKDLLYEVNRLKKKYGFSMSAVLEKQEDLQSQIDSILHREEKIHDLDQEIELTYQLMVQQAKQLHTIRQKAAKSFEQNILNELKALSLENARFEVRFETVDFHRTGSDSATFFIATNKGQDLTPLTESASGGEISRVMLAIKMIILSHSDIETVVFDEVDTGVSGKVASRIGERMQMFSCHKQVICITHLPQVAIFADQHYAIVKEDANEETLSSIRRLDDESRVIEIAKMLSGENLTQEAIDNAKILLNTKKTHIV